MGVRGLTTFVEDSFVSWQRQAVQGHVVIDGSSLCHSLYFTDWAHGGQYPEFRDKVLDYFTTLQRSGVCPVVVLDGIDYKGEKNKVIIRRRKEWVTHIHSTLGNRKTRPPVAVGRILPVLAIEVFQEAVLEAYIPLYVTDGEADSAIVEIANFFSCPAVSCDSDFFLFNLQAGYIPLDRFHWQASPVVAEVFHIRLFAQQFMLEDESLCYFIPAIVGNDFILPYSSAAFTQHVSEVISVDSGTKNRIFSVIKYASKFKSLRSLLCELPPQDKRVVEAHCTKAQELYKVCTVQDPEQLLTSTTFKLPNGSNIPTWMLRHYRSGRLPLFVMEAIVLGKCILRIVVEDALKPSAIESSRELRQCMYALLGRESVTEYYRHGLDLTGEKNQSDFPQDLEIPAPDSLPGIRSEERAILLYRLLKCNPEAVDWLEGKWRLVASATIYWALKCQPPQHLVKALVLCVLLCSMTRRGLAQAQRTSRKVREHRKSPKWMTFLHAFAQWQCVYFDTMALNALLMSPLTSISPACLYDGKVAMMLAFDEDIDQTVAAYPIDRTLYMSFVEAVLSHTTVSPSESDLKPPPSCLDKHGKKTKVKKVHQKVGSTFAHANPFSLLEETESEGGSSSETDTD